MNQSIYGADIVFLVWCRLFRRWLTESEVEQSQTDGLTGFQFEGPRAVEGSSVGVFSYDT